MEEISAGHLAVAFLVLSLRLFASRLCTLV